MFKKVGVIIVVSLMTVGLTALEWSNRASFSVKQAQNLYFESENEQAGSLLEGTWSSSVRRFLMPSLDLRAFGSYNNGYLFSNNDGRTVDYNAGTSLRYLLVPNGYLRAEIDWNRYRQMDYSEFAMSQQGGQLEWIGILPNDSNLVMTINLLTWTMMIVTLQVAH